MKVAVRDDRTHNPSDETYWVSRLRENLTSGSDGEGLETGRAMRSVPRQSFTRQKCFDTWKNDFSQAKAWGKSLTAIENQVLLAIVTSILIVMRLHQVLGDEPPRDEKALRKQDKRQAARYRDPDGTDRPDWAAPLYRYTTKLSRQVLRFFQNCFDKTASPGLYERQLRPMLMAYL